MFLEDSYIDLNGYRETSKDIFLNMLDSSVRIRNLNNFVTKASSNMLGSRIKQSIGN